MTELAERRTSGEAGDRVRLDRPLYVPGLELVCASYGQRSFPIHSYLENVVDAVGKGAKAWRCDS